MATIKDVAKCAGVSVATVSRVINRRGYLSDAVIEKVHGAMTTLDYYPNEMARSLHRQKSYILGLIVPSVSHFFFGEIARHVEYHAHQNGYKVLICNSLQDRGKEREYIRMLRSSQVDGVIMGSHLQEIEDYVNLRLPVISLDRRLTPDTAYICCDNYQGGLLATRHLLDCGCRNLIHVSGCLDVDMLANRRTDAFLDACKEAGAAHRCYQLPDSAVIDLDYGGMIGEILRENPDCDGVFATSDVTAALFLQAARKQGRQVPDDLRIVGFDGSLIAALATPQITTVVQPVEEIARYAVDHLLRGIDGKVIPHQTILPVELQVRNSTV